MPRASHLEAPDRACYCGVRDVNAGTARVGERCSGGAPDIAYRNVIGSNIANVLLVVGLAAVIAPIIGWERTAVREALVATVRSLAALALLQGDVIARIGGIAMLVALAGYLFSSYWLKRRDRAAKTFQHEAEAFEDIPLPRPWLAPVLALVAIRTSLPELATAIVAAIRRQSDVVLGNIIGSNIFNILAILGVTVVIQPIDVSARFRDIDTPVMLGVALLLLALLFATTKVGRLWGILMLVAYAAYMAILFTNGMSA